MSSSQSSQTALYVKAAVAVGVIGVAAGLLVKARCVASDGSAKCPFARAASSSEKKSRGCPHAAGAASAARKCPVSGAAASTEAVHPHGHGAASHSTAAERMKAKMNSILPFQPRGFTPETLALCTGATEDPLNLTPALAAAKEALAADPSSAELKQTVERLEDDMAVSSNMVCISVRGIVFKATPQFYGTGESYSVYAGKEIARCLALGLVSDEEANLPWSDATAETFRNYHTDAASEKNRSPLINQKKAEAAIASQEPYDGEFTAEELHALDLWAQKYEKKYQILGWFEPFAKTAVSAPTVCKSTSEVLDAIFARVDTKAPKASEECPTPSSKPITSRRRVVSERDDGELPVGVL